MATARKLKTGILVHGCHMQASDVHRIVWGDESTVALGRVPHAALIALRLLTDIGATASDAAQCDHVKSDDVVLLFGTGASVHEVSGAVEAEHIRSLLTRDPTALRRFVGLFDEFTDTQLHALVPRSHVELASRNTVEEIRAAAHFFVRRGVERMILVSSNTHAPRCLRDATVVLADLREKATDADSRARFESLLRNLLVSPSEVPYHNATPAMVAVVEPPHRPDTGVAFDKLVSRLFKVPAERRQELADQFEAMLRNFGV